MPLARRILARLARPVAVLGGLLGAGLLSAPGLAAPAEEVDLSPQPMYVNPRIEEPALRREFDPRLKDLWLAALGQPEADLRRQAAEAFGAAFERGMVQAAEAADQLADRLRRDEHPAVRLAAAEALVRLGARDHADLLLERSRSDGPDMTLVVDRGLAAWDHAAARPLWRQRLADTGLGPSVRSSALAALIRVGDRQALPAMLELAGGSDDGGLRLQAARGIVALGGGDPRALTDLAAALAERPALLDRLLAATLLTASLQSPPLELLTRLALDAEPVVAAPALARLVEVDPRRASDLIPNLRAWRDAPVRALAAAALTARADAGAVSGLAGLLGDPDPTVRAAAAAGLARCAQRDELRQPVAQAARRALAGGGMAAPDSWRAMQQGALLAARLGDRDLAAELPALLDHERREVRQAAIIGLREMAVTEPLHRLQERAVALGERWQTLAAARGRGMRRSAGRPAMVSEAWVGRELAEALAALGQARHAPARALLLEVLDKDSGLNTEARAAAAWALGRLHADRPDPLVTRPLMLRLADAGSVDPEVPLVREMAAVALGHLRDPAAELLLTRMLEQADTAPRLAVACRWSLVRITGRDLPPIPGRGAPQYGWFLEPAR